MKNFKMKPIYYRILSIPISVLAVALAHFLKTPNPMMILIIPVVFFAFSDGYIGGTLSGIVSILYSLYFFSNTDKLFTYNDVNVQKVMTILAAVSVIVILVGKLKKRDIKALEEKEELLAELECMNEDLSYAVNEAHKANLAKSQFLSRMSHDIRTPLNVILGMTEFAIEEIDHKETVLDYLKKINFSGNFLLGLINDVLDISKIESGKLTLRPAVYDMKEFSEDIYMMFKPECEKKNIDFDIKVNLNGNRFVKVDMIRFKQIFMNLIANSIKFTENDGRISFSIQAEAKENETASFVFVLQDTGVGMSKSFQEKMFEPFMQETNQFSNKIKGTGLGLAIVKNIVDTMEGELTVDSTIGEGTVFNIKLILPLTEPIEKVQQSKCVKNLQVLQGKNILLVEDQPLNREIAEHIMEKAGLIITCAEDGKQAVEIFESSPIGYFDAILMDLQMPIMDGFEATLLIRAMKREDAKSISIIAMTASAFDEDVNRSLDHGMTKHLTKPIDSAVLYDTLTALIKNK